MMKKSLFGSCVRAMSAVTLAISVPCALTGCGQADEPSNVQDAEGGRQEGETGDESTEEVTTGTAPASDVEVREIDANSDYGTIYADTDGYYQSMCCKFKVISGYGIPTQDSQATRRPQTLVDNAHLDDPEVGSTIDVSTPLGYDSVDAAMQALASGANGVPMAEGTGYTAQTGIEYRRAENFDTVIYVYEWEGTVIGVTMRNVSDNDAHYFLDTLMPYENMSQTTQMLMRENKILDRIQPGNDATTNPTEDAS